MKKPTRLQYFFAQDWLTTTWMIAFPLGAVWILVRAGVVSLRDFTDWRIGLITAGMILVALVAGYFTGIAVGWPILGPILYERELKNGGPFAVGDTVQVLAGPHKGEVSHVYSTWQGDSVRVRFSKDEEDSFKDVFCPTKLILEERPNKTQEGIGEELAKPSE